MRAIVLLLNIVTGIVGILLTAASVYIGLWGLLGPAYGQSGAVLLGFLVMIAPPVIAVASIMVSRRLARRGRASALLVAALPLLLGIVALALSPVGIGLNL